MSRDALVVGINQYPFLKDTPTSKAKHLVSAANNAEVIAQRLEEYGDFRVRRLPETLQGEQRQVASEGLVKSDTLEEAIIQLFNPVGASIPETALLYFIGHGLRKNRGGVTEGFLASSDVDPRKNQWGVSLRWLRELLQKSPVKQQIVWLDCCYSGELFNFAQADLGTSLQEQTRFLIAASREFELAEEDIDGKHGVFSKALWQGLDPRQQPDGLVNNDKLIEYIAQTLKDIPQQPIWYNPNQEIILTGEREDVLINIPDGVCPYKGLRFFEVSDADYFYGRELLTQKLIQSIQVGKGNFLAVLGVSGSGKSSLLRAGLIYQLQQQRRLSGTEEWKIRIFTPGEQPLVSLATAFLDESVTDIQRAEQLKIAEDAINEGATGLARLIKASRSPRTLLIVDQFEEIFTVCQNPSDRQQFIASLLGALQQTADNLCLIFAMRDDFLGKCAAYHELADLIESNLVMVTPMSVEELQRAIREPAAKLGRKIEENLINAILQDLGIAVEQPTQEPEPGMLPLLSYTLEQLWQRQTLNWLKLDSYQQLGGVRKTLENLAEQTYKELSVEEQKIADLIFIDLTQLGEGTPDTRKQIPQRDLVSLSKSAQLVEQVIQKLAKAKLIVTSEQRRGEDKVAVVDVAHEALIRHWSRLQNLLDNNREAIRTERRIQAAAQEWEDKGKPVDYLLTGLRLAEAEKFLQQQVEIVPLSGLGCEFIEASQKERDRQQQQSDRQRRKTIVRLTGFSVFTAFLALAAGMGWLRTFIAEKNAQLIARSQSSQALFASNKEFDALLESIRTGKQMKQEFGINADTEMQVVAALLQAVYGVKERNRIEGYNQQFVRVSFSPDGKNIAAASEDGSIKIWNLDGQEQTTINNKYNTNFKNGNYFISSVSFNIKKNIIAAASDDGSLKFWNFKGQEIDKLPGKGKDTILTSISPDATIIATADLTDKVKLWKRDGQQISSFLHILESASWISALSFSPDGNIIAAADNSSNGVVNLINIKSKKTTVSRHDRSVSSLSFSPVTKMLASVEELNKVILWDFDGKKLESFDDSGVTGASFSSEGGKIVTFGNNAGDIKLWHYYNGKWELEKILYGHSSLVNDVHFILDKMLVSTSADKTIRIWDLEGIKPENFRLLNLSLNDLNFNPDGKTIATVDGDRFIKLWNLDGTLQKIIAENVAYSSKLQFSHDGKKLAISDRKIIKIHNLDTGETKTLIRQELTRDRRNGFGEVSFSADRKVLAFGREDGTIKIFQIDGKEIKTLTGGGQQVIYSPNGKILASNSGNDVKIWSADGTKLRILSGSNYPITSLSFSPDSKTLLAGNENGNIIIWSLETTKRQILQGHTSRVSSLSVRPDGKIFASASGSGAKDDDGVIKFWGIDGKEIKSFKTNSSSVFKINFTPDGKRLAVHTGLVTMWNLDLDYLLSKGCDWVRSYLQHNPNVSQSDRHLCDDIGNDS